MTYIHILLWTVCLSICLTELVVIQLIDGWIVNILIDLLSSQLIGLVID